MGVKKDKALKKIRRTNEEVAVSIEKWVTACVEGAMDKMEEHVKSVADNVTALELNVGKRLSVLEGQLGNGLIAKLRWLERIQWWQLAAIVTLIGAMVGGMFYMTQRIVARVDAHIEQTVKGSHK